MASYSVFTKPWKNLGAEELVDLVAGMGFDAVEFPLREGFQAQPSDAERTLPVLHDKFRARGMRIDDVASTPDERVFSACAISGIRMIRVMFTPPGGNYLEQEAEFLREMDLWIPLCERYGVKVGLQIHCGRGAVNTDAGMRLVSRYPAEHIGMVWDAAHSGLAGEDANQAIETALSHLALVNFKNARWEMRGRRADGSAIFEPYFCPGQDGQCSWPEAVRRLKAAGYSGTWCMPAEYTGLSAEDEIVYAERDLSYLKSLVEG